MADYSKYYEAREVVSRILEQDFIGPVTKDECLAEVPVQYYIMGKLYPQKDTVEALDLARNPLLENEIETYDASISLSNQNNPSSMGVTRQMSMPFAYQAAMLSTSRFPSRTQKSVELKPPSGNK